MPLLHSSGAGSAQPAVAAHAVHAGPDGGAVDQAMHDAEEALITTRAASPKGVAGKLTEVMIITGCDEHPQYYETRLLRSALPDLARLGGRA